MGFSESKGDPKKRVAQYLKSEIARAGWSYAELAAHLGENEDAIKQKLYRGTFSAVFFFRVVAALGLKSVSLKDL